MYKNGTKGDRLCPFCARLCRDSKTVPETTKPCQDGHFFLQRSQSHRSAAVQQDSWLPARAAHRRPDITSHHRAPACGATVSFPTCYLKPRGVRSDTFPPLSPTARGRIRFRREAEPAQREWREWEGFSCVFAGLKHRKKTANSHAAHRTRRSAHQQFRNRRRRRLCPD